MSTTASGVFRLRSNLTLLGAPGSGKGFYGRLLAQAWGVPLFSASSILRDSLVTADLDSGTLVDCEIVSAALLSFLCSKHAADNGDYGHFLMDGFPRTRQQIELMKHNWPAKYQVSTAFRLDVPDSVCAQKIAGRRICMICQQEPNSANVTTDGFDLPPTIPQICNERCNSRFDWYRRPDDASDEIIAKRLADYRHHEEPLTEYYESVNGLCSFTPYFGVKDVPKLQQTLEAWLSRLDSHPQECTRKRTNGGC